MVNLEVMDFKKYLKQNAKRLDREVTNALSKWVKEAGRVDKSLVPLAKAFARVCKGGKGIRGMLVKLGYEVQMSNHKSKSTEDILKVGAAYEIFHSAILTHDDIIDKSAIRRGKKALYKVVGKEQAITLADLGFFLATKLISETDFEDDKKNEAISFFAKTMMETALGQMLDIKKGDVLKVMKFKTARYTISGPLQLGAILAGANKYGRNILDLMGSLGEDLGIAFQIQDDILDNQSSLGRQDAIKYVTGAKKIIPDLTKDPRLQDILARMADYLVDRKK